MRSQDAKTGSNSDEQITHITTRELARAKEAVALLLEQLGLPNYLFDVEPRTGPWEVHIDCAADGGWQSLTLTIDMEELLQVAENQTVRLKVLARWRDALDACVKPTT